MLESEVGRIESHAPRQSIELDQRQRHEEWVSRGDQHRASAQILNAGRNRRPLEQIAKGGAMFGADQIARRRVPPTSIASRRLGKLLHGVLIEAYKLSQIHREGSVFVLAEWVHAQHGFQAAHKNGETQRVQARVQQRQFIVSSLGGNMTRKPQLQPLYEGVFLLRYAARQ